MLYWVHFSIPLWTCHLHLTKAEYVLFAKKVLIYSVEFSQFCTREFWGKHKTNFKMSKKLPDTKDGQNLEAKLKNLSFFFLLDPLQ